MDAFPGRRVDGLVLTGLTRARGLRARKKEGRLSGGRDLGPGTWGLGTRPIDMLVGFSNHAAGHAAARYLGGKGYRSLGFADLPIAASIEPSLTTVQVRATEIGQRTRSLMMQSLAGDSSARRIVDLGFAIVERASA